MILVCAATGTEAACCRRGIAEGGAGGFEVLTVGVGPERAARTLARRLELARGGEAESGGAPTLVVSSGFAGALTRGLERLAWVTAASLHRLDRGRAVPVALPPGLLRAAAEAVECHVVSGEHVVAGAVEALGEPAAADMESAALAEVAAAAAVPFTVLRLVTDTPALPLPPVAGALGAALAAERASDRTAHGLRAAIAAARAPAETVAFLRETTRWREALRAGWRERARRAAVTRPQR